MAESEIQTLTVEYTGGTPGREVELTFTVPLRIVDGKIEIARPTELDARKSYPALDDLFFPSKRVDTTAYSISTPEE